MQVQQHGIDHQARQAYELKLGEALQSMPEASLVRSNISERPGVVPDEVVDDRQFRGNQLASRETPAECRRITQRNSIPISTTTPLNPTMPKRTKRLIGNVEMRNRNRCRK